MGGLFILVSPAFYVVSVLIIFTHSTLAFKLCSLLSDGTRFGKISIPIACLMNALISPVTIAGHFESPTTFYFISTFSLILELFLLYKGKLTKLIGVALGTLLHLFVLRGMVVSITALIFDVSMYEVAFGQDFMRFVNLGAFASQVIALSLFIYFIPMDIMRKMMDDKYFYNMILFLTTLLDIYLIYNSLMFLETVVSTNLVVQELVIVVAVLLFFYIMLVLLLRIFSLGVYKERTRELEVQIDKDNALTSAVFSFAEMIIEVNCATDRVTRMLIGQTELPTEHLSSFSELFVGEGRKFLHPDDVEVFSTINSQSLISDFDSGIKEKQLEYRSFKLAIPQGETRISAVTEEYLWYRMRITISQSKVDSDIKALIAIDEIDAEKQEELQLRKKAETDPLTGGYNRAALSDKADEYLKTDGFGTLFMFDLDNFKGINDNMGHSAGDAVLCEVYTKVLSVFRGEDVIGRIGGDEFVVFMRGNIKPTTAAKKASQICDAVNKTYRAANGIDIEISASIGIAVSPKDGTSFETLFKAADMAMYHSKSIGKNTYTFYDSSSEGFKPQDKEAYMRLRDQKHSTDDE